MPRDAAGAATPVPGTENVAPDTTIESSKHNTLVADVYQLFNTDWPVEFTNFHPAPAKATPVDDDELPFWDSVSAKTRKLTFANLRAWLAGAFVRIDTDQGLTPAQQGQARTNIGAVAKIDVRRNRIVNGDMSVSQENGNTAGTTNGYYAADQWAVYRVTSAGTITLQRVQSRTPAGATDRLRATITTADTALAAGEMLSLTQNLEGSNVKVLLYGTADAKAAVLRFGFKGPAGTYAAALHNSGATRSFVALFTIAAGQANTDTVQEVAIPGDTTGTWLTADGMIGITLDIVLACGSTFQGAVGWQAGNILGTSAVSNGMGTAAAVFELFDVGLKLDPGGAGVYGQYEVGEVHPVYRSERYWEKSYNPSVAIGTATGEGTSYSITTSTVVWMETNFLTNKCKAPSFTQYNPVTGSVGFRNVTNSGDGTANNTIGIGMSRCIVSAASSTANQIVYWHWTANARLS